MRRAASKWLRVGLILLAVCSGAFFTGCASTDPENISSRPWNSPKGWEVGLPGQFNERR
jgi:hypothetical protein